MSALDDLLAAYPTTMTPSEAAEVLATNVESIQRQLRDNELPGYKVHGRWVVLRDELRDYLLRHRNAAVR